MGPTTNRNYTAGKFLVHVYTGRHRREMDLLVCVDTINANQETSDHAVIIAYAN